MDGSIAPTETNSIRRNMAWSFAGQALRAVIRGVYFLFLARALNPAGYGAFVTTIALLSVAAPFSSVGAGNILIKNVARDPTSFRIWWGRALFLLLVSGTLLLVPVLITAHFLLPASIPFQFILELAITELLLTRLIDLSGYAFQAFNQLKWTAVTQVLMTTMRLVAIVSLRLIVSAPTPLHWGRAYALATIVAGFASFWFASRRLGWPVFRWRSESFELFEGSLFAVSLSMQTVYNDIDKLMLSRFVNLDASGAYGAAYRVTEIVFTPVSALLAASYSKFFKFGEQGVDASWRLAKRLLPVSLGYTLVAALGLIAIAPLLPVFLGPGYAKAVTPLRWLAFLPVLRAVHYFTADTLTGAGHQALRTVVQVVTALLNILLNLWIIPRYAVLGATWSSLAADGFLAAALVGCVALLRKLGKAAGRKRMDSRW